MKLDLLEVLSYGEQRDLFGELCKALQDDHIVTALRSNLDKKAQETLGFEFCNEEHVE